MLRQDLTAPSDLHHGGQSLSKGSTVTLYYLQLSARSHHSIFHLLEFQDFFLSLRATFCLTNSDYSFIVTIPTLIRIIEGLLLILAETCSEHCDPGLE